EGVLHREKGLARGTVGIAIGYASLVAATSSAGVMAGAPLSSLAFPALISAAVGLFAITKAVIRTAVTRDDVISRAGLREHRIPVSAITAVARRDAGMLSPAGVQLGYTEGGEPRTFWMAARNPEVLIAAIEQARSSKPARVRVAPSADVDERETEEANEPV